MMIAKQFFRTVAAGVCLAVMFATSAKSVEPTSVDPSEKQIGEWIAGLGDDSYANRQAAADQLTNVGFAARDALAKAAEGPDPEIRAAARRIITLIDDNEFTERLAAFAADVDGSQGATLPGWREFGKLVGADAASRSLFVAMQKEEGALLQRVFGDSPGPNAVNWDAQLTRLFNLPAINQQGAVTAPLGSCATMLFLGALPETNMSDNIASNVARLAQMPPLAESLIPNQPQSAARRLVTAWVVNCPSRNDQVLQQRLDLMSQYELSAALPLPLSMLESSPKYLVLHPAQRVAAISAIGRFGTAKDAPVLEQLLEDRSIYLAAPPVNGPNGHIHSVQVRDVALANLLHLTGQEPIAYGFLHARSHPQWVFEATSLGMENDEQRDAATEQWRAWRAQHNLERGDVR